MKLAVFGENGPTGRLLTQLALDGHHDVVAFTRHPDVFPIEHRRLEIVAGDVHDAAAAVQPSTGICSYTAPDAASDGLTVDLSATSPRGRAYCQSLERAYAPIPSSSKQVEPGQVWTAPSLVSNLGGDDGFFAIDRGGQYTWAAVRGDSCVVVGVGGTTWLNSPAAANVNTDVFGLMKTALGNARSASG